MQEKLRKKGANLEMCVFSFVSWLLFRSFRFVFKLVTLFKGAFFGEQCRHIVATYTHTGDSSCGRFTDQWLKTFGNIKSITGDRARNDGRIRRRSLPRGDLANNCCTIWENTRWATWNQSRKNRREKEINSSSDLLCRAINDKCLFWLPNLPNRARVPFIPTVNPTFIIPAVVRTGPTRPSIWNWILIRQRFLQIAQVAFWLRCRDDLGGPHPRADQIFLKRSKGGKSWAGAG